MARILTERDETIFKKLAPEYSGESCTSSGIPYRSILPPVANHYALGPDDFRARIASLSSEDLTYLCELIMTGEESLSCLPAEFFSALHDRVRETLGEKKGHLIASIYAAGLSCQTGC